MDVCYEDVAKMSSTVGQTLEKDSVLHVLYIFTKSSIQMAGGETHYDFKHQNCLSLHLLDLSKN